MPTTAPKKAKLKGVRVFSAGWKGGEFFGPDCLEEMVKNWREFSSGEEGRKVYYRPPGILGHEKDQAVLKAILGRSGPPERTDLPAAGWPEKVYHDGKFLLVDFGDVPIPVAQSIANREYRYCSVGFDPHPPMGVPGKGWFLKHVGFLGASLPADKECGELPQPEYEFAERTAPAWDFKGCELSGENGARLCFSEVAPMTREQILAWLATQGIDTAALQDPAQCSDAMLGIIYSLAKQLEQAKGGNPNPGPGVTMSEQAIKQLNEQLAAATKLMSEQAAALTAVQAQLKATQDATKAEHEQAEKRLAAAREARVDDAIARGLKDNRIAPAELDKGPDGKGSTLRDALLTCDATAYTFSEAGKPATALDVQLAALERRPKVTGEKLKTFNDPTTGKPLSEEERARQRAEAYAAERNRLAGRN